VAVPVLMPEVAVLVVRMPPTFRDEGVRAALRIRREYPSIAVLLLSQYVEGTYAQELLAGGEGGTGYLLKDRIASLDELRDAVTRVAAGGTVLDPQVVRELLMRRTDPLATLTPREREVLELMAEGRTNAAIAARMVVGVGAVEKNVTSIFQKLGLEDSGDDHRRVLAVLAFLQH
jgi:DNA-binding NarL/FixJ family response regulator